MIEKQLVEFLPFIDNIAKSPSFLSGIDRAKVDVDDTFGAVVFDGNNAWEKSEVEFKQKFEDASIEEERIVQVKVVDIPYIHHYTDAKDNGIY